MVKTNYTNIYTQKQVASHQAHLVQTIDHKLIDVDDKFMESSCDSLGTQWEPMMAALFLVGGVAYASLWSDSMQKLGVSS